MSDNQSAECVYADKDGRRFVEVFERLFAVRDKVAGIDNPQLLWLVTEFLIKDRDSFEIGGYQEALLNELEDRLYPEFDGDAVKTMDYGWSTPDGPLIYDQAAYQAAMQCDACDSHDDVRLWEGNPNGYLCRKCRTEDN